ncbi:histidine phosphatase family protein [Phenylobacterium sp. J367]|uniref:SixA phosphatase family protein n=1 Tax=Phenylobacterium sp. J367 TaxID=2898435 RepID=UPI00215173F4|nr:histidine phosphatase family protein [Phenylobacterium sp. J367]MCR5877560.1 histidine phosphatase family protein [Phenylobacterium sp. J367]
MERLILLRHGKAEPDSTSGDDFDRRLAPRGQRESAAMGEHLADLGMTPDVALVSPSARTRETWGQAETHFPGAQAHFDKELYLADAGTIRQAAEKVGREHRTVMVVGHNPGLQELAVELLQQGGCEPLLVARAARHFRRRRRRSS